MKKGMMILRIKILGAFILLLVFVSVYVLVISGETKEYLPSDPSCYRDGVMFKVGNTIFEIKDSFVINNAKNIPKNPSGFISGSLTAPVICYRKGDNPISVENFKIRRIKPKAFTYNGEQLKPITFMDFDQEKEMLLIPFFIGVYSATYAVKERMDIIQESLDKASLYLTDLPKKNGFYIFQGEKLQKPISFYDFYISGIKGFVLPNKKPVVYRCSRNGSTCDFHYIKNSITYIVEYIRNGNTPSIEWQESFWAAQQYMDNLIIDDVNLNKAIGEK